MGKGKGSRIVIAEHRQPAGASVMSEELERLGADGLRGEEHLRRALLDRRSLLRPLGSRFLIGCRIEPAALSHFATSLTAASAC